MKLTISSFSLLIKFTSAAAGHPTADFAELILSVITQPFDFFIYESHRRRTDLEGEQ